MKKNSFFFYLSILLCLCSCAHKSGHNGDLIAANRATERSYEYQNKDEKRINRHTKVYMEKSGGIYLVPITVNGLNLNFIFDTGASTISMSSYFAKRLIEQGLMSELDIKGKAQTIVADGRTNDALVANIKDVEIGGLHLYNVKAMIKEQLNAPLLLGQSALEKFGKYTIDGYKLIIHKE